MRVKLKSRQATEIALGKDKKDLNMILSKIEQIHSDKLPSESHYDAMGAEYGYNVDYDTAFDKLPGAKAYNLLKKHLSMDEGHYHDMGGEDEMYNILDMPKRLSPKEMPESSSLSTPMTKNGMPLTLTSSPIPIPPI